MGNSGATSHDGERSGIDRRTLIKRAAAAGAVAWTAPIIIGSLTSPAGAVTVAPNTYMFMVTASANSCITAAPTTLVTCQPTSYATTPQMPAACAPPHPALCGQSLDTAVFTIPGGCSCVFATAGGRGDKSNGCVTGTGDGTTSMSFSRGGSGSWNAFRMRIVCS